MPEHSSGGKPIERKIYVGMLSQLGQKTVKMYRETRECVIVGWI